MMNLMKHYKSVVGESGGGFFMIKNGLFSLLKCPQKGLLVPSKASKSLLMVGSRLGVSGLSSSVATMGNRRFFNTFRGAALDYCFGKSNPEQHVSFNQVPGLMVPGTDVNSETRCFLRFNPNSGYLEKGVDCNLLPVPHGYACHGSAYGWVFLVGDDLNTKLMNPFTGEEIQLPSVRTLPRPSRRWIGINKLYVLKAVFSSDPSLQPAPLVLVIHRGHSPRLAYCKPGDISWTSLHRRHTKHNYEDAIFYNDQFYAISRPGYIMAYDIRRLTDENDLSVKKSPVASGPKVLDKYRGELFLLVLDGELIKIERKILTCETCNAYGTAVFLIRRFVASENKWVMVKSLGDNALFLGKNTSFSLRASEHPGCTPNAIYFTDCSIRKNKEYGSDIGVYKLSDQSVMPLYPIGYESDNMGVYKSGGQSSVPLYPVDSESATPPPVWVTQAPCADSSYAAMGRRLKDMFRAVDIPRSIQDTNSNLDTSSSQDTSSKLDSGDGRGRYLQSLKVIRSEMIT